MYYYKTTIQYIGTDYAGFQWQNGLKTIQSEFNSAISKCIQNKFTTMGASRTDTGVHAYFQIVKISSENEIELSNFISKMNDALPIDIKCLKIEKCHGTFKPSTESISKEYRYFFTNEKISKSENHQFIANISNPLDIESMKICLKFLIGEHDFCNFYSKGSNVKSSIRTISECSLLEINPHGVFDNHNLFKIPQDLVICYELKIIAKGFLKQMIRHLVSVLWQVGSGKLSIAEFQHLLNGPRIEKQKWKVASPNGLFLFHITFSS